MSSASSGFNPLSMFKPQGNPEVQRLLLQKNPVPSIDLLLEQQSFPTQFRKIDHPELESYMTYKNYEKLVKYITQVEEFAEEDLSEYKNEQDNNEEESEARKRKRHRNYKYPFIACEILSVDNKNTSKYFLSDRKIVEQQVVVEEVESFIDINESYMSQRSEDERGSIRSEQSLIQKDTSTSTEPTSSKKPQNMRQEGQQPTVTQRDSQDKQQYAEPNSLRKDSNQINQDDFPFIEDIAPKQKMVKQKRQYIITREYPPLIQKLLQYFAQKMRHHILTGYVCRVLNALLVKNQKLYPMLLDRVERESLLLNSHIQSRSAEELVVRICTYEDQKYLDRQISLLLYICQQIFVTNQTSNDECNGQQNDTTHIQNLSFLVCEVLRKMASEEISLVFREKIVQAVLKSKMIGKVSKFLKLTVDKYEDVIGYAASSMASSIRSSLHDQEESEGENEKDKKVCTFFTSKKKPKVQYKLLSSIKELTKITTAYIELFLRFRHQSWLKPHQKYHQQTINQITQVAFKKLEMQGTYSQSVSLKDMEHNCQNENTGSSIRVLSNKRFGMIKILLIKLIYRFTVQNIGFSQQILGQKQSFFQVLLQLIRQNHLSSILHHCVFSIFELVINSLRSQSDHESNKFNKDNSTVKVSISGSLIQQVFETQSKGCLLKFCSQQMDANRKLPKQKLGRKGYIGQLAKICTLIHQLPESVDSEPLNIFKKHKLWKSIVQNEVEPFIKKNQSLLGNYCKLRSLEAQSTSGFNPLLNPNPTSIQFQKQTILQKYSTFLKGMKYSTLDEFQNFVEEESDSEDGDEKRKGSFQKQDVQQGNQQAIKLEVQSMQTEQFYVNAGMQPPFQLNVKETSNQQNDSMMNQ